MKIKLFAIVLMVLLLLLVAFPALAQMPYTILDKLQVDHEANFYGPMTMAASVTQSDGDLTVADDFVVSKQTAISVTNGSTITVTGGYQPLESDGTVTATVAIPAAGTIITLINTSNTTINIADTGTAKLTAAAALGQYDLLQLISDGTNVIELGRSNN